MAGVSLVKGLYHWAQVCGIGAPADAGFESHSVAWQTATVFFAVIDLVAAVGLWLAAAWGAVVWLTAVVSMAVVEVFFPQQIFDLDSFVGRTPGHYPSILSSSRFMPSVGMELK